MCKVCKNIVERCDMPAMHTWWVDLCNLDDGLLPSPSAWGASSEKSTIHPTQIWPTFWIKSIPLWYGHNFEYNLSPLIWPLLSTICSTLIWPNFWVQSIPSDIAIILSTISSSWYDHTLDAWITIDKKRVWQDYKSEIFLLGCFFSAQLIVVKDCKTRALTYSFCLHVWLVWSMINGTKLSGELCEQCQVAWSRTVLCELRE